MSKDENENEPTYDEEEEFEAGDELGTELDDAEQDANQIASAQAVWCISMDTKQQQCLCTLACTIQELEAMKARLAELQKESEKDKVLRRTMTRNVAYHIHTPTQFPLAQHTGCRCIRASRRSQRRQQRGGCTLHLRWAG